jgi:rod shape-determining protein MreD
MIMRQGQQLLLPAKPFFIWGTLLAALLLNMLLNMGFLGGAPWAPDLLAVVLVFWTVHQPLRVGIGGAFVFGLIMDVHNAGQLGQHAMAYTVLSYFAITIHRRLRWFNVFSQAAQVAPLFLAAHTVVLLLGWLTGKSYPGWSIFLAPLLEVCLWPIASMILLAPQRRAPDPDVNRPL